MNASLRAALAAGALALAATSASASTVTLTNGSVKLVEDTLYQDNDPLPNTPLVGWISLIVNPGSNWRCVQVGTRTPTATLSIIQSYTADHSSAIGPGLPCKTLVRPLKPSPLPGVYKALSAGAYAVRISFANFDQASFSASTQVSAVPLPGAALLFGSGSDGPWRPASIEGWRKV